MFLVLLDNALFSHNAMAHFGLGPLGPLGFSIFVFDQEVFSPKLFRLFTNEDF